MLKLDIEQQKIKEQERIKNKIEKNKSRIKMILFVLLVAVLLLIGVVAFMKFRNKPEVIVDSATVNLKNVNGKLKDYINGLGNEYYIRYLGEFGKTGINKEIVEATVEFTRAGSETGIYSKELGCRVVTKKDTVYSILDRYRVIVESKAPADFGTNEYNLVSDFGQRYVADVKVKEAGVEYVYQEYEYDDSKIRYYFVEEDLRHIVIVSGETERRISVIVDRHTNRDLLNVPTGYSLKKA